MLETMVKLFRKVNDEGMRIEDNLRKAKESYDRENRIFFN